MITTRELFEAYGSIEKDGKKYYFVDSEDVKLVSSNPYTVFYANTLVVDEDGKPFCLVHDGDEGFWIDRFLLDDDYCIFEDFEDA